ncbi:MAG: energy-coupling factor ABC transporter permease [Burkholderiales bacterium]|nr:energy-coupling factor ABC transporter permease [Burkholderiales bacterium]
MFILAHPLQYWPAFVWIILSAIALGIALGALSIAVQRKDFQDSTRLSHWLFISFVMVCLWLIKAQVMDNLYIHLIGANVALLILGAPLALLALACTTLITSIILHTSPWIWGMQYLLASVIPLSTVALLHYLFKKWLPHRLFIYIFVRGFFAAAIGMMLAMLINLTLIGGMFHFISLEGNQMLWASPILLGWGEGFLSGAVVALVATYYPEWLYRHSAFTGM